MPVARDQRLSTAVPGGTLTSVRYRFRDAFGTVDLNPRKRRGRRGLRSGDGLRLLRDHTANAATMDRLRCLALALGLEPARLDDNEVVGAIATLVDDGVISKERSLRGAIGGTLLPRLDDSGNRDDDDTDAATVRDWIRIKLVDQKGRAVASEKYEIGLPDGSVRQGRLDDDGCAEVRGIPKGECDVTFPRLSKRLWGPA